MAEKPGLKELERKQDPFGCTFGNLVKSKKRFPKKSGNEIFLVKDASSDKDGPSIYRIPSVWKQDESYES